MLDGASGGPARAGQGRVRGIVQRGLRASASHRPPSQAAAAAYNLARVYLTVSAIRDLGETERWCWRSLELLPEHDRLSRGRCLVLLGQVAVERFLEAQKAAKPRQELLKHLSAARGLFLEALMLIPEDAIADLGAIHDLLGYTYTRADDVDQALEHYQKSIRYLEAAGEAHRAAFARCNVAATLGLQGCFADAKEYALAALRGFDSFGGGAKDDVAKTRELIAAIDSVRPEQERLAREKAEAERRAAEQAEAEPKAQECLDGAIRELAQALEVQLQVQIAVRRLLESLERKIDNYDVFRAAFFVFIIPPGTFLWLWLGLRMHWWASLVWSSMMLLVWGSGGFFFRRLLLRRWGVRPFEERFPDGCAERPIALSVLSKMKNVDGRFLGFNDPFLRVVDELLEAIQGRP